MQWEHGVGPHVLLVWPAGTAMQIRSVWAKWISSKARSRKGMFDRCQGVGRRSPLGGVGDIEVRHLCT